MSKLVGSDSYLPACLTLYHRLDENDDGGAIQAYLLEKTKQRTVPNIFICASLLLNSHPSTLVLTHLLVAKQHVGGNDDFQNARRKGEVAKLIAQ